MIGCVLIIVAEKEVFLERIYKSLYFVYNNFVYKLLYHMFSKYIHVSIVKKKLKKNILCQFEMSSIHIILLRKNKQQFLMFFSFSSLQGGKLKTINYNL